MIGTRYPLADDEPARRRPRAVSVVVRPPGGRLRAVVLLAVAALAALTFAAAKGTGYAFTPAPAMGAPPPIEVPGNAAAAHKLQAKLQTQNKQLAAALAKMAPTGTYIVVDQTQNRLYVMNGPEIKRTAVCSAGSGLVLMDSGSSRKWVFDTPRGVFKVRNKISNPIWKKPDWAFVEEGKTLPKDPADRFESGTLGKYALYLEDGYMIHGTLYTRLLGRSVTHGCIRLGPDDLQAVWDAAPIGTPVFIF
jgi:lipoprotein-anchoring transpeptidase ErfK/SrfK